jgi:dTDP-4-dehydrorhamnose reductase
VFDGKNGRYSESDTAKPSTVYGSQKVEIEDYLQAQGHDHAVLRLARVFGTELTDGTILSSWMRQIQDGDEIICARDQVFSPIHVDDVISVAMAAARLDLSGIYHVCNLQAWSWLGMLRALAQSYGVEANIIECSIRDFNFLDDRPLDLSMDPAKVLAATGLSFRTVESCCEEICKAWKLGIPMGKATPRRFLA